MRRQEYEAFARRLSELITTGRRAVERSSTWSGADYESLQALTVGGLNVLEKLTGRDSVQFAAFARCAKLAFPPSGKSVYVSQATRLANEMVGIIEATARDLEAGMVRSRELVVTADAFESLLGQADYLLEQGFKDPAAMLAGAVLESTLRKMCEVRGIPTDKQDKISTLNDKLAKHHKPPAYSGMYHKQIIAWADVRNNADHGHFDEYDDEHVRAMVAGVREFAARHLA